MRYYDPLGLPLDSARFRLRLIRATLPRPGPSRRVSRVPLVSLHTCCAPYPAGARCALWIQCTPCCLRRDMSGSASELFLCRGCRLHFMLRPACLLPTRSGLSTSRLRSGDLSLAPGPATRRSSAYRDRTSTGWKRAARPPSRDEPAHPTPGVVTAHHVRSLPRVARHGRARFHATPLSAPAASGSMARGRGNARTRPSPRG